MANLYTDVGAAAIEGRRAGLLEEDAKHSLWQQRTLRQDERDTRARTRENNAEIARGLEGYDQLANDPRLGAFTPQPDFVAPAETPPVPASTQGAQGTADTPPAAAPGATRLNFFPPNAEASVLITADDFARDSTLRARLTAAAREPVRTSDGQTRRINVQRLEDGSYRVRWHRGSSVRPGIVAAARTAATSMGPVGLGAFIGNAYGTAVDRYVPKGSLRDVFVDPGTGESDEITDPATAPQDWSTVRGGQDVRPSVDTRGTNTLGTTAPAATTQSTGNTTNRAARNNNPGNIEYGDFARGQGATHSDGRFAVFPTPEAGASAQRALLISYMGRGINTVEDIVGRWSPQNDPTNQAGSTNNYTHFVAQRLGVQPNQQLTSSQLEPLRLAMAEFEAGGAGQQTGGQTASPENMQFRNQAATFAQTHTPENMQRLAYMEEVSATALRNALREAHTALRTGDTERGRALAASIPGMLGNQRAAMFNRAIAAFETQNNSDGLAAIFADASGSRANQQGEYPIRIAADGNGFAIFAQDGEGNFVRATSRLTPSELTNLARRTVDPAIAAAERQAQLELMTTQLEQEGAIRRVQIQEQSDQMQLVYTQGMENLRADADQRVRWAIANRQVVAIQDRNGNPAFLMRDQDGNAIVRAVDITTTPGPQRGLFGRRGDPTVSVNVLGGGTADGSIQDDLARQREELGATG